MFEAEVVQEVGTHTHTLTVLEIMKQTGSIFYGLSPASNF
jgi:hypothetical protein